MDFVIGDLHGEKTKLNSLIKLIIKKEAKPSLIFIGDYIDKGEQSRKLLDYLIKLKDEFATTFLMGNHEFYWLNLKENKNLILKYGGLKTLNDFCSKSIEACGELMISKYSDIFNNLKSYYETDKFIISHSGLPASITKNWNVEKLNHSSFLFNRYEFIRSKSYFKKNKKIIFGHTAFFTPYVDNYKIGIDTGACYSKEQPLTSFCLETQEFYNSNGEIYNINKIKKDRCPVIIR